MKTNYIDEILEEFRNKIYREEDALFDRRGNNVSLEVENFIKQKLIETQQKTKQEIIEKIEGFKIPENAKVVNGKDVNIKSFQNNLVDFILKRINQ